MSEQLSYNGKSIEEMTKQELQEQYETNKKRSGVRAGAFGAFSLLTFAVVPALGIVPLGIGVITAHWLRQDNEAIKEEIDKR